MELPWYKSGGMSSVIINLVVTTPVTINYFRANLFSIGLYHQDFCLNSPGFPILHVKVP